MKKSLLALAVLGAFAGVASAQSSVTLYGTIDTSAQYVKNDGSDRSLSLGQSGINSSQLGFKGVEDLGGGLKASFVLLAGVNADTGTTNSRLFNRRSTVSLSGGFGEIRLGRDYTPTFWNNTNFDAFGTNGLGDSSHVQQLGSPTFVRADNSIGYFLPSSLGGFYGQFMGAAGEGGTAAIGNPGRYIGGRVGFAAGPFDVAFAAGEQSYVSGALKTKTYNVGGSYNFGVVQVMGYFDRDTQGDVKENRYSLSAVVPLGQGEIHAGYSRSKATDSSVSPSINNVVSQYALGYVYNVSKRTALYTTVSRVNNGDLSDNAVGGNVAPTLGGKSTGAEFGVRHFF